MSYTLKGSSDIIAVASEGVFEYEVDLAVLLDTLLTTPATVIAAYIINELAIMSRPVDGDDWPLYISHMPDGVNVKTNCGCIYDTTGIKDGRLMVGDVIPHHGIQIRIRSNNHETGWDKIEEIVSYLDAVTNVLVTVDDEQYLLNNVSRASPIASLGQEAGSAKRRFLFTVNYLVTMKRII